LKDRTASFNVIGDIWLLEGKGKGKRMAWGGLDTDPQRNKTEHYEIMLYVRA
jgi:hypothetical protein